MVISPILSTGAWGLAVALTLVAASAAAQTVPSRTLAAAESVRGQLGAASAQMPDGSRYDCYALDTTAGQPLALRLRSTTLVGRLRLARGGQCDTARLLDERHVAIGHTASLDFTTEGGRYLVLALATAASTGAYELSVSGQTATTGATSPLPGEDQRRALMERQVAQRHAELAAEQARRAAEAETARMAALERQQREADTQAQRQANRMAVFNAFVGGFSNEWNAFQQQQAQQQGVLDDINRQARQIARQREAAERAQQSAREAAQVAQNARARESAATLAVQLAEANTYRDAQIAKTTDPAERQRLAAESARALATARELGLEDEVRRQTLAISGGTQVSAMQQEADRRRAHEQAEADRRATEQNQIREAEARRLAEQSPREQTARVPQAAAPSTQGPVSSRPTTAPAYAGPTEIGTLTRDWSPWVVHAEHNGVTFSWRARVYDRESLWAQWKCDNHSGEARYCAIQTKTYQCFAGERLSHNGGGIGEASNVAAGREHIFRGDPACSGAGLTFLRAQAVVNAANR